MQNLTVTESGYEIEIIENIELDNIFKKLRSETIKLEELSKNARLTFEKHYAIKNAFIHLDHQFHLSNLIKDV